MHKTQMMWVVHSQWELSDVHKPRTMRAVNDLCVLDDDACYCPASLHLSAHSLIDTSYHYTPYGTFVLALDDASRHWLT